MNFSEACQSAREGNFISHEYFDDKQSIHEYENRFYYEDGACLNYCDGLETIEYSAWSKKGWFVKHSSAKVDREKLKLMHKKFDGYINGTNITFEDCIIL